jgi:pimeloyl-ACP methyl ester carboxylesterase
MGARISLHAVTRHPERFRSLVLGGVGAQRTGRNEAIAAGMRADSVEAVDDRVASGFRRFAEVMGTDLEAMALVMQAHRPTVDLEALASIRQPVLLVRGSDDDIARDADKLAASIPGSRLITVAGKDHATLVPDATFKQTVVAFLTGNQT